MKLLTSFVAILAFGLFIFANVSQVSAAKVSIKAVEGFGSSLRLNGNGTAVSLPPLFANTYALTFEGWFKADDFTSLRPEARYVYSQVSNASNGSYTENTLRIEGRRGLAQGRGAKIIASFHNRDGSQPLFIRVNDPVFTTGVWHHVAMIKDGYAAVLYLDGQEKGRVYYNETDTLWNDPKSLVLGAYAGRDLGDTGFGAYQGWKGEIDEIRFSDTIRYKESFAVRTDIFGVDIDTLAIYHLDGEFTDSVAISGDGQGVGSLSFVTSTVPYLPVPAEPYITSIVVPPCTSLSCNNQTTVIINGENFRTNTRVYAVGYDDTLYTEDSLTPEGQHYMVVVGRTLPHQIIVDFRFLPCQTYRPFVYNQTQSLTSKAVKSLGGDGRWFDPSYCRLG